MVPKTTKLKSINRGFTIIEVMIVLAIAGLIMLIVFEAVPALERGNRNGQRKDDVTAILQAVSHYELNNSGEFPSPCGVDEPKACNTAPNPPNVPAGPLYYAKLSYYDPTQVSIQPESAGASVPVASSSDSVVVYNYEKCDLSSAGKTVSADADYRDVVALYALETGTTSAITPQCQQL